MQNLANNKRMVLSLCGTSERDCDPSMSELSVFYFDGAFVLTPLEIRRGDTLHHCTKIYMMGQTFVVTEDIVDINTYLFMKDISTYYEEKIGE